MVGIKTRFPLDASEPWEFLTDVPPCSITVCQEIEGVSLIPWFLRGHHPLRSSLAFFRGCETLDGGAECCALSIALAADPSSRDTIRFIPKQFVYSVRRVLATTFSDKKDQAIFRSIRQHQGEQDDNKTAFQRGSLGIIAGKLERAR